MADPSQPSNPDLDTHVSTLVENVSKELALEKRRLRLTDTPPSSTPREIEVSMVWTPKGKLRDLDEAEKKEVNDAIATLTRVLGSKGIEVSAPEWIPLVHDAPNNGQVHILPWLDIKQKVVIKNTSHASSLETNAPAPPPPSVKPPAPVAKGKIIKLKSSAKPVAKEPAAPPPPPPSAAKPKSRIIKIQSSKPAASVAAVDPPQPKVLNKNLAASQSGTTFTITCKPTPAAPKLKPDDLPSFKRKSAEKVAPAPPPAPKEPLFRKKSPSPPRPAVPLPVPLPPPTTKPPQKTSSPPPAAQPEPGRNLVLTSKGELVDRYRPARAPLPPPPPHPRRSRSRSRSPPPRFRDRSRSPLRHSGGSIHYPPPRPYYPDDWRGRPRSRSRSPPPPPRMLHDYSRLSPPRGYLFLEKQSSSSLSSSSSFSCRGSISDPSWRLLVISPCA